MLLVYLSVSMSVRLNQGKRVCLADTPEDTPLRNNVFHAEYAVSFHDCLLVRFVWYFLRPDMKLANRSQNCFGRTGKCRFTSTLYIMTLTIMMYCPANTSHILFGRVIYFAAIRWCDKSWHSLFE